MSFAPKDPPGEEWAFNHGGMGAQSQGCSNPLQVRPRKKVFINGVKVILFLKKYGVIIP